MLDAPNGGELLSTVPPGCASPLRAARRRCGVRGRRPGCSPALRAGALWCSGSWPGGATRCAPCGRYARTGRRKSDERCALRAPARNPALLGVAHVPPAAHPAAALVASRWMRPRSVLEEQVEVDAGVMPRCWIGRSGRIVGSGNLARSPVIQASNGAGAAGALRRRREAQRTEVAPRSGVGRALFEARRAEFARPPRAGSIAGNPARSAGRRRSSPRRASAVACPRSRSPRARLPAIRAPTARRAVRPARPASTA